MEMRSSTRGPLEFYSKSLRIDGHGTDIFANAKEPKFYWGWDLETLDQEGLRPLIVRIFVNSYLHDPLYGDYPLGEPSLPDSSKAAPSKAKLICYSPSLFGLLFCARGEPY